MPGQEELVLTKEMIILRPSSKANFDSFYLVWAMTLGIVRDQWRRVIFMQTNREDVGSRYLEIRIPVPKSRETGQQASQAFRKYYKQGREGSRTASIIPRGIPPTSFLCVGCGSLFMQPRTAKSRPTLFLVIGYPTTQLATNLHHLANAIHDPAFSTLATYALERCNRGGRWPAKTHTLAPHRKPKPSG